MPSAATMWSARFIVVTLFASPTWHDWHFGSIAHGTRFDEVGAGTGREARR